MPENEPTPRDRAADDAAWQDLVRRLEETGGLGDPPEQPGEPGPDGQSNRSGQSGKSGQTGQSGTTGLSGDARPYGGSVPTHRPDGAGAGGSRASGTGGMRQQGGDRAADASGRAARPAVGHPAGSGAGASGPSSFGAGPRDYSPSEDPDDGEFVPEDPPQLGSGEPLNVLAWCCVVGAPIALLLITMFWRAAPSLVWIGICVAFLASAGYLVWRLPRQRPEGDDGARV